MAGQAVQHSFAGTWYPGDRHELQGLLTSITQDSIRRTGPFTRPGGVAFLVPHAAPCYSGAVAATVYRHIQASGATRVLLLGFSHRWPLQGIAIPSIDSIQTPLGAAPVDRTLANALAQEPPFRFADPAIACDHSVEIQVPFLQALVPHATIVPLYVGHLASGQRHIAAEALRRHLDSHTVLIASSDLTHFGAAFNYQPFDVDEDTPGHLDALDSHILQAAGSLDPDLFLHELDTLHSTVCGREPIALLLETVRKLPGAEIFQDTLDRDTSGALTGDYAHSVSYAAAGYFPAPAFELDELHQAELLVAAREALDEHFSGSGIAPSPTSPTGRAFVSLYTGGHLRGCIGRATPTPLLAAVRDLAIAAATDDPRFASIQRDEDVQVEIHILTPPKWIHDPRTLIPGEHGALLHAGERSALLLPSVAARYGLDRTSFLQALAHKAGLPGDAWHSHGTRLSVFRAQTFSQ